METIIFNPVILKIPNGDQTVIEVKRPGKNGSNNKVPLVIFGRTLVRKMKFAIDFIRSITFDRAPLMLD